MVSAFSALGLYNATKPLSTKHFRTAEKMAGFSSSWVVPFASRLYVEKMTCGSSDEELVRVLVNDRVIPMETCGADELGRCRLDAFVESLSFASNGGRWDQCFV